MNTRAISPALGLVAVLAAVALVFTLPVLGGTGPVSEPDRLVVDTEPLPLAAAVQVEGQPMGRIDDITTGRSGTLVVAGWSTESDGLTIAVDGRSLDVGELHRRHDVEAATGMSAWGFRAELSTPASPVLCLTADGRELDCQPWSCETDIFTANFVRRLRRDHPDQRFTAHVKDTRTGCEYELQPDVSITTASVIKVEILGGLLLQAQAERRDLTQVERGLARDMMRLSLNPPTSTLWQQIGGLAGMRSLDNAFGADDTFHSRAYGATVSTAEDRTEVTLGVLYGGGPLNPRSTEVAWRIMARVHPAQQWGASAGVAEGYRVANKNGFYPLAGAGWRVGSTGFVADPTGGGYALTILTDNNQTQAQGIDLVERIARRVNRRLTVGPAAHRPFDDTDCITHTGGDTWEQLARDLGLRASAADDVRLTAGGDGPFRGQLVCVP